MSLTYKVLTISQPDYLHNRISVQSSGRTRSSSLVTLARPPVSFSLQITNRSFTYASAYLWNQLPSSFRHSLSSWFISSCAYHLITVITFALITITASTFTPDLKLISFTNPFLHSHSYSFRTDFAEGICTELKWHCFVLVPGD